MNCIIFVVNKYILKVSFFHNVLGSFYEIVLSPKIRTIGVRHESFYTSGMSVRRYTPALQTSVCTFKSQA